MMNENPTKGYGNPDERSGSRGFCKPGHNNTLQKKAKRIIPHYKPGKKLLFKKAELLVWIQSYKESIGPRTKTRST
jgi:hypothetical protein